MWADMFSLRQQLAHGYCVQAFQELVDEDQASRRTRRHPQGRLVLYRDWAMDKLLNKPQ